MNKSWLSLCQACVVPTLCLLTSLPAAADEAGATSTAGKRPAYRDDRPDDSRGWVIISKESYWPLCYESLDRIQATHKLIGNSKPDELAEALELCSAWLKLAASAAMTDGTSGVAGAAERMSGAADLVRQGAAEINEAVLTDVLTLGLVSMAKSHVLRADEPDQRYKPEQGRTSPNRTKTPELAAIENEIAKERVDRAVAQYRYDATQSQRHLTVAQTYLQAAARLGGFQLPAELTDEIPEVAGGKPFEVAEYVEQELRPRTQDLGDFVDAKRQELAKRLYDIL